MYFGILSIHDFDLVVEIFGLRGAVCDSLPVEDQGTR